MLILSVVGLTEIAPLRLIILLDLLSFADLLASSLLLHSLPLMSSMYLLLTDSLDSAHHKRLWSDFLKSSPRAITIVSSQ
jgi:hypothetical protein